VYIDDGTAGDSGELKIDVDGHEYVEQENFSYDQDNVVDSVAVDTADGGHIVYSDTDHSGTADLVTEFDAQGDELHEAHYDAATGHWVDEGADAAVPDDTNTADTNTADSGGNGGSITVDTAAGPRNIGPATVDTDDNGSPDTAVVHDANGDTVLYTDSHGDGQADVATEITADGHVVIADHTGDHQWTEVQQGHLDAAGQYQQDTTASGEFTPSVGDDAQQVQQVQQPQVTDTADDQHWAGDPKAVRSGDESGWAGAFSDAGSAQGVVRIDATTGQWISQN
jgi:hypothetical protein